MKEMQSFMPQSASSLNDPALPRPFEQDAETMLEKMHLKMEQMMKGEPLAAPGGKECPPLTEELEPNRLMSLLLMLGILAGTLLVVLTDF